MRVLIEGYNYNAQDVKDVLFGLNPLEDINQEMSINYVGYFYNSHINDCVFILPKVLIDETGKVFGRINPSSIINFDAKGNNCGLNEQEKNFIYEFAVWIYRTIAVYNKTHFNNGIILHRKITQAGGSHRHKSRTFLDILITMVHFNRENQDYFIQVLQNIHSGFNKINWTQTIAHSSAIIQKDEPLYLNPINKKRQINFDEELLIIFFSILNHINKKYGFPVVLNLGYQLIVGKQFDHYIKGFGIRRLKQIKYKYFSDKALRIWELCYAFFERASVPISTELREYLLAKNFNIVFEAIIDELIGDKNIPAGLKEQEDGKLVDHMYSWQSLTTQEENKNIYYIGDSKYYKLGNQVSKESVYKQYTYARNVIQWNLDLFLDESPQNNQLRNATPKYRDDITEGYNIIPNFFISAKLTDHIAFVDRVIPREKPFIQRQFENRLFDRDTLLISHYDVNFLYIVSLYAREKESQKAEWRTKVRNLFRKQIQTMLQKQFSFYVMKAHEKVDGKQYLKDHFKDVLGKLFTPFDNQDYYSLALDNNPKYNEDNAAILSQLRKYFYVVECGIGENPEPALAETINQEVLPSVEYPQTNNLFFVGTVKNDNLLFNDFLNNKATTYYTGTSVPADADILKIGYFMPSIGKKIKGYYKITAINVANKPNRTANNDDGKGVRLIFTLGNYTSLNCELDSGLVFYGKIETIDDIRNAIKGDKKL
jgi:hypothetical protein